MKITVKPNVCYHTSSQILDKAEAILELAKGLHGEAIIAQLNYESDLEPSDKMDDIYEQIRALAGDLYNDHGEKDA